MVSTHKFGPYTIDDDQQKMIVFTDQGLVGGYILDNLIILAGTWEGTEEEISGTITFGQHYKRKITTGPYEANKGYSFTAVMDGDKITVSIPELEYTMTGEIKK